MEQWLGLQTWGTDLILWVQSGSNDFLTLFLQAITFLGDQEFYLLFLPLVYWSINRQWGLRLLFLTFLSIWSSELLKNLLRLPRPDSTRVARMVEASGYGLPSGHAQTGAMVVWGYLAAKVQRWWFTTLAVVLIFLIGLSRVYLGVHFPQDVLAGWLLGLLILFLTLRYEERVASWVQGLSTQGQAVAALALSLLVLVTVPSDIEGHYPAETAGTLSGILLGVGLGSILEAGMVRFRSDGSIGRRLLRYVVGMAVLALFYVGGGLIPDLQPWLLDVIVRVLRYCVVGLMAVWGAPWLFVRLRLAESDLAPGPA